MNKKKLLKGLLQHNYFPAQKKTKEEMPPVFSSTSLSIPIAESIHKQKKRKDKNYSGYGYVEYKATKFNNVPRYFGIPHPKAHIDLTFTIVDSWALLKSKVTSKQGRITPKSHADGRVIIMDYEASYLKSIRHLESSFSKNFLVKTDISSCFPSLYSHALPWALVGIEVAKKKKSFKWRGEWFNKLDEATRWQRRNETQGVLVGPATSNILSEVILCKVDNLLSKKFHFERYIDDYSCYTDTYEKAEEFVRCLSQELKVFNLHLSPAKTIITQLPISLNDDWTSELLTSLPKQDEPSLAALIGFLDKALSIQRVHTNGSVIKYAAKAIIGKACGKRRKGIAKYLLGLSLHYPVLIPVYGGLLDEIYIEYDVDYKQELIVLLEDRILNQSSDGICWVLYYLRKTKNEVDADLAAKIVSTEDSVSMALLGVNKIFRPILVQFCNKLSKTDFYAFDRHWLLLYQLYMTGEIENPYPQDKTFELLKKGGVNFVDDWI